MKKETVIRIAIIIGVAWTLVFHLLEEILPPGLWGFTTGAVIVYLLPMWLAKKIE